MRPRLPLCLLPFVGVLAFASSFNYSNAATITVQNSKVDNSTGTQYYGFAFNGISNEDRATANISNDNTLLQKENNIVFQINNYDGQVFTVSGAGTYITYENAITLYAGNNGIAYNGHDTPYIRLNNSNLTFSSKFASQYPINKAFSLPKDQGLAGPNLSYTMPNQWTYFSSMGVQGQGDVTFNFTQDFHEIFVMSSLGSNAKGQIQFASSVLSYSDRLAFFNDTITLANPDRIPILKPNAPNLDQDIPKVPADFIIQGNVNVTGGMFVYFDEKGTFKTGIKGADAKNQYTINVSGITSVVDIEQATTVDIYSKILVDNSGTFVIDLTNIGKKSAHLYSGFTVTNYGVMYLNTDGMTIDSNGTSIAQVTNGGKFYMNSDDFVFNSDLFVGGLANDTAPINTRAARFIVGQGSTGGVFNGKVTVELLATLGLYGSSTFEQEITVQNYGILILGGEVDNSIVAKKGVFLGENARVEANTNGNTIIKDSKGNTEGLVYHNNGSFAVFNTQENGSSVYKGGFSIDKGFTVSIEASLSQTLAVANRGDYVIGTREKDPQGKDYPVISGGGNIAIEMNNPLQCITLDGANTFTGTTTINTGILVLTNETIVDGKTISSSIGSSDSALIFGNKTSGEGNASYVYTPVLALSTNFTGNGSTDDTKYLNKKIQLGSTWGDAYATIVTGDYTTLSDKGDGETILRQFASDVVLRGQISSQGDSKSNYYLIKDGTGSLTIEGWGAGQGPQANFKGFTLVRGGTLVLGNKDNVASMVNDKTTNTIGFDGTYKADQLAAGAIGTLKINKLNTSFNNNIDVLTQGRVDVIGWSSDNQTEVTLAGDIYNDKGYYVANRYLEIFSAADAMYEGFGVTLAGNIILEKATIKYYGNQLTLKGLVGSDVIFDLSGANNTYNDSDYTGGGTRTADIRFIPNQDNTLFDATLIGARDFIKEGTKTLVLGSDLSTGAYSGSTYVKDGTLLMYKKGLLSENSIVYVQQSKDTQGNVTATGTLDVGYTSQKVRGLVGNGVLQTSQAGMLTVTSGHGTAETDYFGGNVKGTGMLIFDATGANKTFRLGNKMAADGADRNIEFKGTYVVKGEGILSVEENNILAHGSTVGLFNTSKLFLAKDNDKQVINGLYSLKDDYMTDTTSSATVELSAGSSLDVTMGYYSGNFTQDGEDITTNILTKRGAVDSEGELLGLYDNNGKLSKENTLFLIGNGNANQFNYTGSTLVSGGTLYLGVSDAIEDENHKKLDLSKTGELTVQGTLKDSKNFTLDTKIDSQVIIDLTNGDVIVKDITLTDGVALTTLGGQTHQFQVTGSMHLKGAKLNIQASLDANNRPALQGIKIGGEVTVTLTDKNYIDLQLEAGNWGYNADTQNGAGNTMRVFTAAEGDVDHLIVVGDRYVLLHQDKIVTTEGSGSNIDIKVTRNDVAFSDFITGSIGNALDHADAEYVATNKLKGQSHTILGDVLDQLYVMTSQAQVAKAVQELSGASNYVLPTAQLVDLRQHVDTVRDRIARIGVTPGTNMTDEVYHGWAMGLTNTADIKADGQVPGFKKNTWGGMVGFDTDVSAQFSWGLGFAYTSSDIDIDLGNTAKTEAYYFDGFGRYQQDKWSVTSVVTAGSTTSDTKRRMTIGDVNGIAKGSPNGYFINALSEVGYDIDLPNQWIIQPLASLNLGYLNVGSYTESGMGNAGLDVDSTGQFIARLGAGVRSIYSFYEDAWSQKANLQLRAMVLQDLTDVSPDVSQSLIGSTGSFNADGSGMGKTAFQLGAGVTVPVAANLYIFANVDTEFRSDANSVGGNLGVRYTF